MESRIQTRASSRAVSRQTQAKAQTSQRQFWQLMVCLILFLAVYAGKGLMPHQVAQTGGKLLAVITADIDLRAAVTELGSALGNGGEGLCQGWSDFCAEVFSHRSDPSEFVSNPLPLPSPDLLAAELAFLSSAPERSTLSAHYLGQETGALLATGACLPARESELPATEPAKEKEPNVPAAGTVILTAEADAKSLPRNCTMDQLSLGELDYALPVSGVLTSPYGFRTHPISGEYLFHTGVDIDGKMGTPILAFADGTVEYVGKDDSYGLYFQLDHGNGIKSFYAHCNSLCVTKGQRVSCGEEVATVGATGNVTGPHLHLELKFQRLRFDPDYYLDFSAT